MNRHIPWLLAVVLLVKSTAAIAQPYIFPLGLAITDRVNLDLSPGYLQGDHPLLLENMRNEMQAVLTDLGRCKTYNWHAAEHNGQMEFTGLQPVEYVVHAVLNRADRMYRNQVVYQYQEGFVDFNAGNPGDGITYQVFSQPAISLQMRVELVRQADQKIIWSAIHDSTEIVPHDTRAFLLHPVKYPGMNHPELIRNHMADIVRMRINNRMVDNQLEVADFWFMSKPRDDLRTARELIKGLASSFYAEIDNNLPLAGRIKDQLPDTLQAHRKKPDKPLFTVNIGSKDGVKPKLKMDVWRSPAQKQKVGKIEIVSVDSTTSVARLRKLDRKMRRRGDGVRPGDLVISRKRRFNRTRTAP